MQRSITHYPFRRASAPAVPILTRSCTASSTAYPLLKHNQSMRVLARVTSLSKINNPSELRPVTSQQPEHLDFDALRHFAKEKRSEFTRIMENMADSGDLKRCHDMYIENIISPLLAKKDCQSQYMANILIKELRSAIIRKYFAISIIPEMVRRLNIPESILGQNLAIIVFHRLLASQNYYGASLLSDCDFNVVLKDGFPYMRDIKAILRHHQALLAQHFKIKLEVEDFTVRTAPEVYATIAQSPQARAFYTSIRHCHDVIFGEESGLIRQIFAYPQLGSASAHVQLYVQPFKVLHDFSRRNRPTCEGLTNNIGGKLSSRQNWSVNIKKTLRIFDLCCKAILSKEGQQALKARAFNPEQSRFITELQYLCQKLSLFMLFQNLFYKAAHGRVADHTQFTSEQFCLVMQRPRNREIIKRVLFDGGLACGGGPGQVREECLIINELLDTKQYSALGYKLFSELDKKIMHYLRHPYFNLVVEAGLTSNAP